MINLTGRWDAAEAMSWIAFRDPRPLATWHEAPAWRWSRPWPFDPPNEFLEALRARAERQPWSPNMPPTFAAWRYRATARRMVHDTGEDAATLTSLLDADLARMEEGEKVFQIAEAELTGAVREGRLQAWGHRLNARGVATSEDGAEAIPASVFYSTKEPRTINRFSEVEPPTDASGHALLKDILKPAGLRFDGVTFDAVQIRDVWPPPLVIVPSAAEWMFREATQALEVHGFRALRDDLVKRCALDLGCRYEDAKGAYRSLPEHLRRPRGRSKTRSPASG